MEFIKSVTYAPAVSQQKGAVSRREPRVTGPVEFFTRSRTIGTTSINRANANAVSKNQKPHFTTRQSCGGYRVNKLGGSASYSPEVKPESRSDLNEGCSAPSTPRRCLTAAPPLAAAPVPRRCPLLSTPAPICHLARHLVIYSPY